jgi:glycosyltransferase involved in cell wall biosynthesis
MSVNIEKPVVSVVIPTKNRPDMLIDAINSVLNQTFKQIEIIVIADSCDKRTSDGMKVFEEDSRVKFYNFNNTILGGAKARNIGIDKSSGDFIAFLDDDDYWESNKLKTQLDVLLKNPDCNIVFCNHYRFVTDGKKHSVKMKNRVNLNDLLKLNYIGSFSFTIIRKSSINNIRIDDELSSCQDWDLWIKILSNTRTTAINTGFFSVYYRIHDVNRISTNMANTLSGYRRWAEIHTDLFDFPLIRFHTTILKERSNKEYFLKRILRATLYGFMFPLRTDLTILLFKNALIDAIKNKI